LLCHRVDTRPYFIEASLHEFYQLSSLCFLAGSPFTGLPPIFEKTA